MTRTFDYQWSELWKVAVTTLAAIGYIVWRKGEVTRPEVVIAALVILYMTWRAASPLCRVTLTATHIDVSFLLPFHKGGHFSKDEIASYAEVGVGIGSTGTPFAGILQPSNRNAIWIWASGIKDFGELNAALLELYPRPQPNTSDHSTPNA